MTNINDDLSSVMNHRYFQYCAQCLSRNFVHIDQFDNVEVSRSSIVFFARVEQFDNENNEKNKE